MITPEEAVEHARALKDYCTNIGVGCENCVFSYVHLVSGKLETYGCRFINGEDKLYLPVNPLHSMLLQ